MLKEYFDSHEHKDQPPRQFRLTAEAGAKESAYLDPAADRRKVVRPMKVMAGRIST